MATVGTGTARVSAACSSHGFARQISKAAPRRAARLLPLIVLFAFTPAACAYRTGGSVVRVPAANDVETTLFLIGDAGSPDLDGEPVFRALAADVAAAASPVIVFLGDNVYPRGIPLDDADDRLDAERRLAAQIAIATETGAEAIFVPGNHDWDFAGEGRRERLMRAERFGRSIGGDLVRFLPNASCPGPEAVDLGTRTRLIVLDTQWWLFPDPVEDVPATCENRSREDVTAALRRLLEGAGERHVVVAGHHPLATRGPHGGYFTLRQHIFPLTDKFGWAWIPLPGIGSLYPIARRMGISDQDLAGSLNRRMREAFESVFRERPPLVYAAGHEHSLQLSSATAAKWHVVSGAGNHGHTTPVGRGGGTVFATSASGYVRLDIARDGSARLGIIEVDGDGVGREVFSTLLE